MIYGIINLEGGNGSRPYKDVGFCFSRREVMVSLVHFSTHVPNVPVSKLGREVSREGARRVYEKRQALSKTLHSRGDEELAQQAEREAKYVLDVYA